MIVMDPEASDWDIVSGVGITALGAAASWLLGHGWTTGVSRLSWVADAYGRPMTDLKPASLRVMQLVTGELD
jgi:hypothetical protein